MNKSSLLIQGIFLTLREELASDKIGGDLLIDSLKATLAIHLLRNYCTMQPKLSGYPDGLMGGQKGLQSRANEGHSSLTSLIKGSLSRA